MAEEESQLPQAKNIVEPQPPSKPKPKGPKKAALNKLYALPAPLRTFPLPTLVPHNPISLFHILYVWLSQTISPPSSNFDLYQGWWSPETRSVHVTDARSIRGLWEQGFYGKGNLSRSEPDWINREKTRRGTQAKVTSEEVVRKRREERQQTKWERARLQQEAIENQKSLEEEEGIVLAKEPTSAVELLSTDEETLTDSDTTLTSDEVEHFITKAPKIIYSPVGPLELLRLPNSALDMSKYLKEQEDSEANSASKTTTDRWLFAAPVGPLQILAMPNSVAVTEIALVKSNHHVEDADTIEHNNGFAAANDDADHSEAKTNGNGNTNELGIDGHSSPPHTPSKLDTGDDSEGSVHSDESSQTVSFTPNGSALANGNGANGSPKIKRQKSVRFSPTVEKNTFIQSEPPSPKQSTESDISVGLPVEIEEEAPLVDKEHFQLTMEEAFFLSYSLGALTILDPVTKSPITNDKLFDLFRKLSYFPPVANQMMSPDDPFMLNYVVYHHYRSLGWCVRGGAKFSCDYMLYNRGPVFFHAEFAVIILPSYSDPYWSSDVFLQNYVKKKEHRTWAWLHCINRVITQVKKSLILVYVDIPKPLEHATAKTIGVDGVLGRYKIREFVMQRWQVNRERGVGKKT